MFPKKTYRGPKDTKNTTNKYVREDMEKKEPLYVVGGIINWFIHYGKQYSGFTKK